MVEGTRLDYLIHEMSMVVVPLKVHRDASVMVVVVVVEVRRHYIRRRCGMTERLVAACHTVLSRRRNGDAPVP